MINIKEIIKACRDIYGNGLCSWLDEVKHECFETFDTNLFVSFHRDRDLFEDPDAAEEIRGQVIKSTLDDCEQITREYDQ